MRKLLILLLFLCPFTANADAWHYTAYWSGLPIGDLYAEIKPGTNGRQELTAIIRSQGLAKSVSGYQSTNSTTVLGLKPQRFTTHFRLKKSSRDIAITYGDKGAVLKETNTPAENRQKRPAVSANLKNGTVDPLTAYLLAKQKLEGALESGQKNFSIPVYDGRRRFNLNFAILGMAKDGTRHITFNEEPVAGYTNNEMQNKAERDSTYHLYLDRNSLLPLRISGNSPLGVAEGKLVKTCATLQACM